MKCKILHESAGRMRVHLNCRRMTLHQADVLEYYLRNDGVLGGCAECYGVEILAQTGEAQCYAGIPRITMRGTRIFTLIDQLAYFAVTPDSLNDVLQDWL